MNCVKSAPAVSGKLGGKANAIPSSFPRSSSFQPVPPQVRSSAYRDQDVRVPCRAPIVLNGAVLGCGRCMACRARAAKIWGNRIALEMAGYEENLFITLTYNNENLPPEGSLFKRQVMGFIKRLRRRLEYHLGLRCRYFLCGEYGDKTGRPHYHAILFGVGTWANDAVAQCWPFGFVQCLPADRGAGPYVAGYMVKKLNREDRCPREPEFITMSTKPGIGCRVADALVEHLQTGFGLDEYGDVPTYILAGKFKVALGGYLRRRMRRALYDREAIPMAKARDYAEALLALYDRAADAQTRADFSHKVRAAQIEQKFKRSRQNETF